MTLSVEHERASELKPCPFCGGQVAYSRYSISGEGRIKCPTCQTMLVFLDMDKPTIRTMEQCKEETIQCWNKREYEDRIKRLQTEILKLNQIHSNLYSALSTYMDEEGTNESTAPDLADTLQGLLRWIDILSDHVSRRDRIVLRQLYNLENSDVDKIPICQQAQELLVQLGTSEPSKKGKGTMTTPKASVTSASSCKRRRRWRRWRWFGILVNRHPMKSAVKLASLAILFISLKPVRKD